MGKNPIQRQDSDLRHRLKQDNSAQAPQNSRFPDAARPTRIYVDVPGVGRIDLLQQALFNFTSADPKTRFAALCALHQAEIGHLVDCGASSAEVQMHLTLMHMLNEAKKGNYSNPMWPVRSKKKGRSLGSFDKSSALGFLMALIACQEELDGCEDYQACSRAAKAIDERLKNGGLCLEQWAPHYSSKHREIGLTLMDGDKRAHPLTKRLIGWFNDGPPGFDKADVLGVIVQKVLLNDLQRALNVPEAERAQALAQLHKRFLETTVAQIVMSMGRSSEIE